MELSHISVFKRDLGSLDEGASTPEIAEKILYFHPPGKTDDEQLERVGLHEALVDFAGKFSDVGAETVGFDGGRYAFFNCEPQCYFVVGGTYTDGKTDMVGLEESSSLDAEGAQDDLLSSVPRFAYELFRLLHGPLSRTLDSGIGLPGMERLRLARKMVRKGLAMQGRVDRDELEGIALDDYQQGLIDSLPENRALVAKLEAASPAERLRAKLASFLDWYVGHVRFSDLHIFQGMTGFHYCPVNKATYLSIQLFVNKLQARLPAVTQLAFLWDDHLVWTTIPQATMRVLYFLISERAVKQVEEHFWVPSMLDSQGLAPRVYAADGKQRRLAIYRQDGVTLLMMLEIEEDDAKAAAEEADAGEAGEEDKAEEDKAEEDKAEEDKAEEDKAEEDKAEEDKAEEDKAEEDTARAAAEAAAAEAADAAATALCHRIEEFLVTDIGRQAARIREQDEQLKRSVEPVSGFRFIYFNEINLALKLSGIMPADKGRAAAPPTCSELCAAMRGETLQVMDLIYSDFKRSPDASLERYVKLASGSWVVARKADKRLLMVLLDNKVSSILDASEVMQRLGERYFGHIFLD